MAHKIIWSPNALAELKQISDHISVSSVTYADSTILKIVESVKLLETFPRMGRRVPETNRDELREILVFQWRIIYELSEFNIDILNIVHGAQRTQGGA